MIDAIVDDLVQIAKGTRQAGFNGEPVNIELSDGLKLTIQAKQEDFDPEAVETTATEELDIYEAGRVLKRLRQKQAAA